MGAEQKTDRRNFLKGGLLLGAGGLSVFSFAVWDIFDKRASIAQQGLQIETELKTYRYQVKVPTAPCGLTGEDGMFLTRDRPTTEMDSQGVVHMLLTGDVLRYDPRIVKNPLFPYESLPDYDIVNPVNVGVIDRFPQK